MQLKGDPQRWGSLAKFFHWTIVLLIIVQGTVGLIMVELPKKPNIIPVYTFHKSVGLTILALAVLRLSWRLFDRRPTEPAGITRVQAVAARAGHALLYLLLFLVPLSGWWFDSVSSLRPLYWFGLVHVPPLGGPDPSIPGLKEMARDRHEWLFWILVAVAAGHAAMALVHQFINRDGTLARMLPQRRGLASAATVAISTAGSAISENVDAAHVEEVVPSPPATGAGTPGAGRNERERA
jgi:cytochrome b561